MSTTVPGRTSDPRIRLARLPQLRHWLLATLVGTLVLFLLGFAAKLIPGVLPAELALDEEFTDHQKPILNWLSIGLSTAFSPPGILVILAISFLYLLLLRRSPANAFAFTGLAAFGWLCSEIFKVAVAEARPNASLLDHPLLAESGHDSFPSGHTTFIACYAIACFLFARRTRWQLPVAAIGILAILGMSATRLYVSAHYLTDVIGSILLALTAAVFFTGVWNRIGVCTLDKLPLVKRIGPVPRSDQLLPLSKESRPRGHADTSL